MDGIGIEVKEVKVTLAREFNFIGQKRKERKNQ